MSEPQMPPALTATVTWPGPIFSNGRSSTRSSWGGWITTLLMGTSLSSGRAGLHHRGSGLGLDELFHALTVGAGNDRSLRAGTGLPHVDGAQWGWVSVICGRLIEQGSC